MWASRASGASVARARTTPVSAGTAGTAGHGTSPEGPGRQRVLLWRPTLPDRVITRPAQTAARASWRLPRRGGQCRTDGVLAGLLALPVRERPERDPHAGVLVACRQLSA